jgi:putative phosphoribosyl transferase
VKSTVADGEAVSGLPWFPVNRRLTGVSRDRGTPVLLTTGDGSMTRSFENRCQAGRILSEKLGAYAGRPDVMVLGLPRGGIAVAFEVAQSLGAPLDVFPVRKLGVPGQEELAMGAIAGGGVVVLNEAVIHGFHISEEALEAEMNAQRQVLAQREAEYRGSRAPLDPRGRIVIVVDDGLATGSTMRAAVAALRQLGPSRLIVAVPTASPATCAEFQLIADECVCAITPEHFRSVGLWYEDFEQVTDEEVRRLLSLSARNASVPGCDCESGLERPLSESRLLGT